MFLQKSVWRNSFYTYWMEILMIKKLIILFKLGRKVAKSDILNILSKFQEPPLAIKFLFKILTKLLNFICFAENLMTLQTNNRIKTHS